MDIGVGERWRQAFLRRLATVKEALVPTPAFVLVVGDSKNRSGGPLDTSLGCNDHDLRVMGDGEMKSCLQDVARIVEELRDPVLLEAMANMGRHVTPPTHSHILVMEALIVLLTPRKDFQNHAPLSSFRGVTWTEARHILGLPDKLWIAISHVDTHSIPSTSISTLQASG